MALNTPVAQRLVGGTEATINATAGAAKQLVANVDNNTLVLFDGTTMGGHPMAKANVKIKTTSPNLKINGGTEADLTADITITSLPGTIPGSIQVVENPEGQPAGTYLKFDYTNADGNAASYFVDLAAVVDIVTAGDSIKITDNVVSVDRAALVSKLVKANGGLTYATGQLLINLDENSPLKINADGKLTLELDSLVDVSADGPFELDENGKLTLKSVVSADTDNMLKAGSDGLAFLPGDMGTL